MKKNILITIGVILVIGGFVYLMLSNRAAGVIRSEARELLDKSEALITKSEEMLDVAIEFSKKGDDSNYALYIDSAKIYQDSVDVILDKVDKLYDEMPFYY